MNASHRSTLTPRAARVMGRHFDEKMLPLNSVSPVM